MIDILLATYNGETYLDTQIASIVNQTYRDWNLYIHDDGSSDKTIQIIRKWVAFDSRIILVEDGHSYHNSGRNFLELLRQSKSDLICFCDQDDYWLDNKLERMISIFPCDINSPHLLNTACFLWDSESGEINYDISFSCPVRLCEIFFRNGGLQGCAMMFNAQLRDLVLKQRIDCYSMHDFLITMIAFCFGSVSYLKQGLLLYRNHHNTVTIHPANHKIDLINRVIKNKSPVVTKDAFNDIKQFYKAYGSKMNTKQQKVFNSYLTLPKKSALVRFIIILFSSFSISKNGRVRLLFKLLKRPYFG